MAFRIVQAAFSMARWGVIALSLALTPLTGAVAKVPINTSSAPPPTATTATNLGEPVDVGDLLDGLDDMLPSFAPTDETDRLFPEKNAPVFSNDPVTPDQPESKQSPKETPDPSVKATDDRAGRKDAPQSVAPAPYKVYAAPRVMETPEPSPKTTPPADTPPVIIASPETPQGQRETRDGQASGPPAPPPVAVTALGNRFLPILPPGAPSGAPPWLVPIAANRDLGSDLSAVTRAIIVIHDITRNAAESLATMVTLAGSDGGTTLILAPQFPLAIDITHFAKRLPNGGETVARWPLAAGHGGWQAGGLSEPSSMQAGISSFSVIDLLLLYLADHARAPALQTLILAGHGAGGDFVQRYAAAGRAPEVLNMQGLSLRFLVANPSSFLYMTAPRPIAAGGSFAVADSASCPDVNAWPYGLDDLGAYARRVGKNAIRLHYPERWMMVMTGQAIEADSFLDTGCAAMAQGETRLDRADHYRRYLDLSFGTERPASQEFITVGKAGYDPVAMFGSYCGMVVLFGDGACDGPTE